MAHTLSTECFSPNKSTTYLVLCLSLNSFCNETRIWASLNPGTRCVISIRGPWVQLQNWVLARFGSWLVDSGSSLSCTVSKSGQGIILVRQIRMWPRGQIEWICTWGPLFTCYSVWEVCTHDWGGWHSLSHRELAVQETLCFSLYHKLVCTLTATFTLMKMSFISKNHF